MSLATRCTACGTVFRVVQDQLKVSEGWVRCGRCDEVFSALEGLFDLDRDGSSDVRDSEAAENATADTETISSRAGREDAREVSMGGDEHSAPTRDVGFGSVSVSASAEFLERAREPTLDFNASGPDVSPRCDLVDFGSEASQAASTVEIQPDSGLDSTAEAPPEFVREAQAQARWRRPWVRTLFVAAVLVLSGALVGQFVHHFRDTLAARFPSALSPFENWCSTRACVVRPPRSIQDVLVDNTSLTKAQAPDAFTLLVALRNRSTIPVAMPSVELSLTDSSGRLVSRRVLPAADFRAGLASLPPGVETPVQLTFSVGVAGVAGYTIEIFNP